MKIAIRLDSENVAAFRVEYPCSNEFVDPFTWLERWIELDERFRPEDASLKLCRDKLAKIRFANGDEAAGIRGVVVDQLAAKVENVHRAASFSHDLPCHALQIRV